MVAWGAFSWAPQGLAMALNCHLLSFSAAGSKLILVYISKDLGRTKRDTENCTLAFGKRYAASLWITVLGVPRFMFPLVYLSYRSHVVECPFPQGGAFIFEVCFGLHSFSGCVCNKCIGLRTLWWLLICCTCARPPKPWPKESCVAL